MKISVEDGVVVCSLDNKVEGFLSWKGAHGCFNGFYNGKLKISPFSDTAYYEAQTIEKIIRYAEEFGVEVDEAVYERLNALKETAEAQRLQEIAEREERERRELWQRKCTHGCGRCKYRRRVIDDHYCAASGDLLDEKQVNESYQPKYIEGKHYFNYYEPFPSENCIYKIN